MQEAESQPMDQAEASENAGFALRLCAYVLDLVILAIAFALLALALIALMNLAGTPEDRIAGTILMLGLAMKVGYFMVPVGLYGATPGKRLLGLRIVNLDGSKLSWEAAIGRLLFWGLSYLTCGIGFLLIAVRKDKRAMHDLLAETRVIQVGP